MNTTEEQFPNPRTLQHNLKGNASSPSHDLEEQVKQLHMKLWRTSSPELSSLPPSI